MIGIHWSNPVYEALTTAELMLPEVAQLKAAEVSGEHARRVIADLHRVASGPEEQPFQLAVTKQSIRAEVPDKKSGERVTHTHTHTHSYHHRNLEYWITSLAS